MVCCCCCVATFVGILSNTSSAGLISIVGGTERFLSACSSVTWCFCMGGAIRWGKKILNIKTLILWGQNAGKIAGAGNWTRLSHQCSELTRQSPALYTQDVQCNLLKLKVNYKKSSWLINRLLMLWQWPVSTRTNTLDLAGRTWYLLSREHVV